jgi:hypothetical protein
LGSVAQSPNQVGLVVRKGDGSVVSRCIEFVEDEISGYDALMRSGLRVGASQSGGIGVTICGIDGEGCPPNNCFCACSGEICTYWSYWHLVDGDWSYASMGANSHRLRPGDVDGWTWGQGEPPPIVSLEEICAPPATPTPTATETLTATPVTPLASSTPSPEDTPPILPTATLTPTAIQSARPPADTVHVTPTYAPTRQQSKVTLSSTAAPQAVMVQRDTPTVMSEGEVESSPTLHSNKVMSTPSALEGEPGPNYTLFGVLLAALAGVTVVILWRKK